MEFNTPESRHLDDDMLNAWIDGVVSDDERPSFEGHLATCAECRAEMDGLLFVKQAMTQLPTPVPPRSFQLSPEQASLADTNQQTSTPAPLIRLLPVVRALSIAAVFALLVLGGANALGPVRDALNATNGDLEMTSVTNSAVGASEKEYPPPLASAPGQVVDQGQAATSSNSGLSAIGTGLQPVESDSSDGQSMLQLAAIVVGIFAAVMVGLWIVLGKLSRARSTDFPVTRK